MADTVKIEYIGQGLDEQASQAVWQILCQCDQEFVPPLSARNSSTQKNLASLGDSAEKPWAYFEQIRTQHFLLACKGDEIVAFMTFKPHYICDELRSFGESFYVSTACVEQAHRRQGIFGQLYACMEDYAARSDCPRVATRTWSQNTSHLATLEKRGYRLLNILKNDRGAGIDTVYYGKTLGPA